MKDKEKRTPRRPERHDPVSDDPYVAPWIYDLLMTPGTAREADVLQRIHRRWTGDAARRLPWLEPACGSGRLLRVLAGRGRRLIGYDADPAMIDYARASLDRRGLGNRARAVVADMADPGRVVRSGASGFAFNPWNSLRHLRDDAMLQAHLTATAAALAPGGVYAVGLSLADPGGIPHEEDVWTAARGRCRVLQVINWEPLSGRRERAHVQVVIRRPRGEEHRTATYDLRTYTEVQWDRAVAASPFRTAASLDLHGRPRDGRGLPYRIEVLRVAET